MMDDKKRLELLSELRNSEGWKAFTEELLDAKHIRQSSAVYEISTVEELWRLKGWIDAVDSMLDVPDSARGELEEIENGERTRTEAWH